MPLSKSMVGQNDIMTGASLEDARAKNAAEWKREAAYWQQQFKAEESKAHLLRWQLHQEAEQRTAIETALRELARYMGAQGFDGGRLDPSRAKRYLIAAIVSQTSQAARMVPAREQRLAFLEALMPRLKTLVEGTMGGSETPFPLRLARLEQEARAQATALTAHFSPAAG